MRGQLEHSVAVLLALISTAGRNFILAYIDPGTGSMVFQVLAAAILSAGFFFRGLRTAIVGAIARVLHIKSESAEPDVTIGESVSPKSESELRRAA